MAGKGSGGKKQPPIKIKRPGAFTAKAKAAGKSPLAYANQVMANPDKYPPLTVKQANFAKNFGGASKVKGNAKSAAKKGGK